MGLNDTDEDCARVDAYFIKEARNEAAKLRVENEKLRTNIVELEARLARDSVALEPMTLQDAIVHARSRSAGTSSCAAAHAQLAVWLERLATYESSDGELTDYQLNRGYTIYKPGSFVPALVDAAVEEIRRLNAYIASHDENGEPTDETFERGLLLGYGSQTREKMARAVADEMKK